MTGPSSWEPSFSIAPGRHVTTDDCIHKKANLLVLVTLRKACALPSDMEHLAKCNDTKLTSSLLQSCFQTLQKLMVVIDRFKKQGPVPAKLDEEKAELEEALRASTLKAEQLEVLKDELVTKLKNAEAEIEADKAKIKDLEATVHELEGDVEAWTERENRAEAETESKCDETFRDVVKQATTQYSTMVMQVRERMWARAWRTALREVGIPEDHPALRNPRPCPPPPTPAVTVVTNTAETVTSGSNPAGPAEIDVNVPAAPSSL